MAFVALVALAIVSLRFASSVWQTIISSMTFVIFWAAAIAAIVDRGPRQLFAIGLVTSMGAYGALLFAFPRQGAANWRYHTEFNPDTGSLPTTQLLALIYRAVVDISWYDMTTGKTIAGYDPARQSAAPSAANITLTEWPSRYTFMAIGHCWWAILLGIVGGWFAQWLHRRRSREPTTT